MGWNDVKGVILSELTVELDGNLRIRGIKDRPFLLPLLCMVPNRRPWFSGGHNQAIYS